MSRNLSPALSVLFFKFEKNPELFSYEDDTLFARAEYNNLLKKFKNITVQQSYIKYAKELENAGLKVEKTLDTITGNFKNCVYLPTQQKNENLYNFALLGQMLEDGGRIFCAMENNLGAPRFQKNLGELFGNVDSLSRDKCRFFWADKNQGFNKELYKSWLALGKAKKIEQTDFVSKPGVFGWEKIDIGSELLCENISDDLKGAGADLGCGYGYISAFAMEKSKNITEITLVDSEQLAIESAMLNLDKFSKAVKINYKWADVLNESETRNLDFVLMNPPFHFGKKTDPNIGKSFIKAAAEMLKRDGVMYMVCNLKLPYEQVLKENFSTHEKIAHAKGFKVFKAIK